MSFNLAPVQTLGSAQIDSTNIAEPSGADPTTLWSAATNYAAGATVYSATTHKAYQSAQAGNLNHDPATAANVPTWWLDMGATNKFCPFDRILSKSCSVAAANIHYRLISTASMSVIALFGLAGSLVGCSIYDTDAARRNLITYSADAMNAVWNPSNVTATAAGVIDHIWGATAVTVKETVANTTHNMGFPSISYTTGLVYTASIYVQRIGGVAPARQAAMRLPTAAFSTTPQVIFDLDAMTTTLSGGATGAITFDAVTNYWRLSITATADTSTSGRANFYIYNGAITYIGNTISGFYISGGQVEQGSLTGYQWIEDATRWGDVTFADVRIISPYYINNSSEAIFTGANADVGDYVDLTVIVDVISGTSAVTEIVLAFGYSLGEVGDSNVGSVDFSVKSNDQFGNALLTRRSYANKADYLVQVSRSRTSQLRNFLNSVRATPVLFYDDTHTNDFGLSIYGWWTDFNFPIKGGVADKALMTLSVQGLS